MWNGKIALSHLGSIKPQGHETLHGLVQYGFIEAPAIIKQAVTLLTGKARTLRNARKEGNQRRLPRARQHNGAIKAFPQLMCQLAPSRPAQFAMADVQPEYFADLLHTLKNGLRPPWRYHSYTAVRPTLLEGQKQALGHYHVTDPGRADHQDTRC